MKRIMTFVLVIAAALFLPVPSAWADNSVSVTIPSFNVTVNERSVDSIKMQYPMIVYNNVTYFPLTWNWCGELGLASSYTEKDGLYIANYTYSSLDSQDTAMDEGGRWAAGRGYTAVIPSYPVYINGQQIDNDKEEYPLLNFQNITYFPLTWRFVVDEFGWDQAWDNASGYTLCTYGPATEYAPGTHHNWVTVHTVKTYRDYAIINQLNEERSIDADHRDSYVGRTNTYYKLDYATDNLTPVASEKTADTPYASGAVIGETADDLFKGEGSVLFFGDNPLLDLTADAGNGNAIDTVYATSYSVNGMTVYAMRVLFTGGAQTIPAPYTPSKYYAFIDQGDGALHQIKSWPTDQILSAVYPHGTDGVYICSNGRIFDSPRFSNGRSWICAVDTNLSETTLNGRWADWNSLEAVGMDDAGNLYLLNKWFSDYDDMDKAPGKVSPVNDGYFRLGLDGSLTKIYPFVKANKVSVTPAGDIYIDMGWLNGMMHLQTGKKITP